MGARGPVPKRTDQRRRRNKDGGPVATAQSGTAAEPEQPSADGDWHPAAARWYASLAESGQSRFYEPSDWAQAWVWADLLSRQLFSERPSAQMVAAWSAAATELLTTEGARRRARLELERAGSADADEDAAVAALDDYRARLSG
ncbi:hypothetical protein QCN29_26840 [Streptomyces sp. HNM0663]|uniref:Terminase small subunit n=1 Tax=Streptomyces chengmaiensis TaxID=3040919 RepID=A0ABT6HWU6_9ACTN|nr:hypothetical protein [Streptomyces chengmaiensis]MDH2392329.1 hypothetical protein [Streptomyces chengmaiensis]